MAQDSALVPEALEHQPVDLIIRGAVNAKSLAELIVEARGGS